MKKLASRNFLAHRSIPAIVAVGSSLAALPVAALELGEITVQSRLGQPLRASIAYALAPNEQLSNYCVTMRPGPSVSGLPGIGAATVSVSRGVIMLSGQTPLNEPMVSAHVVVNCPYSANLAREYVLFFDPIPATEQSAYERATVTQTIAPQADPIEVTPAAVERAVTAVQAEPVIQDIQTATRYRVQTGESLSEIAQRIENRSIGLWHAVNEIFAANPDAFMNNNPNQLKAGSWLLIPSFDGSDSVVAAASQEPQRGYADLVASTPKPALSATAVAETAPAAAAEFVEGPDDVEVSAVETEAAAIDMTVDLQPGDIILDAELAGPVTASSSPNVPTGIIVSNTADTEAGRAASATWLAWLAGSGIAVIFGLLMFGRRLRGDANTAPPAPLEDQPQQRRFSDTPSTESDNVEAQGVDYDLTDDSPTEENLVLDANLAIGTGLEGATSGDSQDFGFAATTKLDIELPFEPVASIADETDMLRPLSMDDPFVLDSEVMPEDDDDDYDMSVIIDATKIPLPEDVTERDLKAIEVTSDDDALTAENYTISKEVDFTVLEQDYEDEMSATQALNEEIARAAADLTGGVKDDNDATSALPLASVTELDITAQMPAQNDEISNIDDTGDDDIVTVNTAADDETVEMPAEKGKVG